MSTTEDSRTNVAVQLWKSASSTPFAMLFRAAADAVRTPFYRAYERWLNAQTLSWRIYSNHCWWVCPDRPLPWRAVPVRRHKSLRTLGTSA